MLAKVAQAAGVEQMHAIMAADDLLTGNADASGATLDIVSSKEMGIPTSMLPEIRPSLSDFRTVRSRGSLAGVPIHAILGDQQAAWR